MFKKILILTAVTLGVMVPTAFAEVDVDSVTVDDQTAFASQDFQILQRRGRQVARFSYPRQFGYPIHFQSGNAFCYDRTGGNALQVDRYRTYGTIVKNDGRGWEYVEDRGNNGSRAISYLVCSYNRY